MDFGHRLYLLEPVSTFNDISRPPFCRGVRGGTPREDKRDAALTASYAVLAAAYLPMPLIWIADS